MSFTDADTAFMRVAMELAAGARPVARPNPAVGCVIVRDGTVVGRGATERPGHRHAEIVALDEAGGAARDAHVYVTLEPCSHHGRTPPCVDALIRAKVGSVTFAAIDPNPVNRGAGGKTLAAAGIKVSSGLLEAECVDLNAGFFSVMTRGRPFIRCKLAMSLDGAIAMRSGQSQWITGAAARQAGHALRGAAHAVITGAGTVRADDPALTARTATGGLQPAQPVRVVIASQPTVPADARMLEVPGPVLELVARGAPPDCAHEICEVATDAAGRPAPAAIAAALAERDLQDVLLEAGPRLTGAFAEAGLIDEYHCFIAPTLLGSETLTALVTPAWTRLADGQALEITRVEHCGPDLAVRARVRGDR